MIYLSMDAEVGREVRQEHNQTPQKKTIPFFFIMDEWVNSFRLVGEEGASGKIVQY